MSEETTPRRRMTAAGWLVLLLGLFALYECAAVVRTDHEVSWAVRVVAVLATVSIGLAVTKLRVAPPSARDLAAQHSAQEVKSEVATLEQAQTSPATGVATPVTARPQPLRLAAVIVWVFSALMTALMVGLMVYASNHPAELLKRMLDQSPALKGEGITQDTVTTAVLAVGCVVIVWCAATSLLTFFVWLGRKWAYPLLVVCVIVCALFSFFSIFTSAIALVPLVFEVLTIRCLLHPIVKRWLANAQQQS